MNHLRTSFVIIGFALTGAGCQSVGPDARVITNTDDVYGYHTSGAFEFDVEMGSTVAKVDRTFVPFRTESLRIAIITDCVDAESLMASNDGTFLITIRETENDSSRTMGGKLSSWFLYRPSRTSSDNQSGQQLPVLPVRAWGPPTNLERDIWYEFEANEEYSITMEWIPNSFSESASVLFKPVLLGRPRRYSVW